MKSGFNCKTEILNGCIPFIWIGVLVLLLTACDKEEYNYRKSMPPIAWDQNSFRILSPTGGYPRLIQLQDKSLFCVYDNYKGMNARRSFDYGDTWSEETTILPNSSTNTMSNPEIMQMEDGTLLASVALWVRDYNETAPDTTRQWKIGVSTSTDNGNTWSSIKIIYTAGYHHTGGCWEPKTIQLPSGELQLFFSDNLPYGRPNLVYFDQNISMFRSLDGGETWTTEPQIIAHRVNFRDGMPTPIVLKNHEEIVCPIEDNGSFGIFKISMLRTKISDSWPNVIGGNSPRREYTMQEIIPTTIGPYAGGPYIAQLPTGETVLSCMSSYNRPASQFSGNKYEPLVAVGDENARNFSHWSNPFDIPDEYECGWGSIAALDNGEIIVLAGTSAFSEVSAGQIIMVKGRLIRN